MQTSVNPRLLFLLLFPKYAENKLIKASTPLLFDSQDDILKVI